MTTTAEDLRQWQYQREELEKLLRRVEDAERTILSALDFPGDPLAIAAALKTRRQSLTERQYLRVVHAQHALLRIEETRRFLSVDVGMLDPIGAANAALWAGLYAGNAALNALEAVEAKQRRRHGGLEAAEPKRKEALKLVAEIDRLKAGPPVMSELKAKRAYLREHTEDWSTLGGNGQKRLLGNLTARLRRAREAEKSDTR